MRAALPPKGNGGEVLGLMYQPRSYRHWIKAGDLLSFEVVVRETDLFIRAWSNLRRKALKATLKYRRSLERYIERYPPFLTTLKPLPAAEDAPLIVKEMVSAAARAGLAPMAAVAGALAERVGRELLDFSPEVIVENGGDIFLKILKPRLVGVYAGGSPFTGRIALEIQPEETPLGVCTSSGTVGHSLSFGKAEAVIALSPSTPLADAAATAVGNRVKEKGDIPAAIEFAKGIEGLKGIVIIMGDNLGVWGEVTVLPTPWH